MRPLPGKPDCCWTVVAPETSYPPLQGKHAVDIAVIGGGIVGLTAALQIAKAGRSVAVVEALRVGRQVTGRSTAKITTQHRLIYDHLIRTVGREKAQLYADANRKGAEFIESCINEFAIPCDFERRSAITWIEADKEGLADIEAEAEAALSLGLPADVLDRAPLPFATGGGLRFTDQAQFNPALYCIGLAAAVVRSGGQVFERSRVIAVEREDLWRIRTEAGEIRAESVFLATNLPVAGEVDFSHYVQARCHTAAAFRIAAERAPDGMFLSVGHPSHSIRVGRDDDGLLLIVLGPHFITGQEGNVARRFLELEDWTRERFKVGDMVWRWTNEDYDTADRIPYVGAPSAKEPGLYIATGFNAWGITNGTAAGLLVADQVLGRENPSAALYDPTRPLPKSFHKGGKTQSKAADVSSIRLGEGGVVQIGDETFAVHKTMSGIVNALSASCTHQGCTVTWNNADKTWDCPCHGSIFSADGSVLHGPAVEPLPSRKLP
ncbi:MAG TPA: FAD-dependent oxidoreductase [Hyphomicrobiaceae bacterium]|jgi:glycine/D-amino acid oxidase-like deaminating enzyme/nitrite reductase/ring-hydroxylating ferredoxin subunit